jgi:hypothetical protein
MESEPGDRHKVFKKVSRKKTKDDSCEMNLERNPEGDSKKKIWIW